MFPEISPDLIRSSLAVILGLPLGIVALNEIILRLKQRGNPTAQAFSLLRTYVLPLGAIWLFLSKILNLGNNHTLTRIMATLFSLAALNAALTLVNNIVFGTATAGSWQSRMPKLLLDLIRLILILTGLAIILSVVWGLDLAAFVTALGVGSLVLGLALQEPLGNVFSGILLLMERPIQLGDYINIEGSSGKIIDINWRTVHLEMSNGEQRIVPNGVLGKASFTNFSRPTLEHSETITVTFSYQDPPGRVKEILTEIVQSIALVKKDPPPAIAVADYKDNAIVYEVSATVNDYRDRGQVRDEFLTRLWYAAARNGLTTPNAAPPAAAEKSSFEVWKTPEPASLLSAFPQFGVRSGDDLGALASRIGVRIFTEGERPLEEGVRRQGLFLIASGEAAVSVTDAKGERQEIAHLERGEYFGEDSLFTGRPSEVTVTALTDLVVVLLDAETAQAIFDRNPRIAREIGDRMDSRRRTTPVVGGRQ